MSHPTIDVTAVRFTSQFETIPRRFEFEGVSYELSTNYKKVTIVSDHGTASLVDVTDDKYHFRLREELCRWHLVSMSSLKA